jgi:hypothetical protein
LIRVEGNILEWLRRRAREWTATPACRADEFGGLHKETTRPPRTLATAPEVYIAGDALTTVRRRQFGKELGYARRRGSVAEG